MLRAVTGITSYPWKKSKKVRISMNNKNILNSILPSEGSPSGLARDVKPGLNSSTKNNKNIMKEEIPEDVFMRSIRPA